MGGCSVHCKRYSSIPGFSKLDAIKHPFPRIVIRKHCQMSLGWTFYVLASKVLHLRTPHRPWQTRMVGYTSSDITKSTTPYSILLCSFSIFPLFLIIAWSSSLSSARLRNNKRHNLYWAIL